ncbi:MAG: hypothetical protein ACLP9L_25160 [Thermoguttaceae bacterium]
MPASDDLGDNILDAALRADVEPHDTAPLREAVLSQTAGIIRFRRRMRKGILAASLAGCYVAGLATMALQRPAEHETPAPPAVASSLPRPSGPPNREVGGASLTRAEIVHRDADRCFERGDVKEAVRLYDLSLKLASADHRASSPEQDSWLLMALKDAKAKEITHDRQKQE